MFYLITSDIGPVDGMGIAAIRTGRVEIKKAYSCRNLPGV